MKPSFAIIGCGKVGTVLGKFLAEAGYRPAGFASRSLSSARQAAESAGAPDCCFENMWDAAKRADIVFITTPDGAIKSAFTAIAENRGFAGNTIIFHCSGALSSAELTLDGVSGTSVGDMGGEMGEIMTGSIHPLQSFAARETGNPFENIMMAVEGDAGAVETARKIATDLGARPFTIHTDGKILYHAAAVVASNYLVTLMNLAIELMAASGLSAQEAFEILTPLIKGTLANIKTTGIPDALTGPIARGDVSIVEKHVQAICALSDKEAGQKAEEMADYYIRNGIETIKIARAKGTLSETAAEELLKIFR